jgi:hypothetical protein
VTALWAEVAADAYDPPDRSDPVVWVGDELGESLYAKQREIAQSVAANRRTAVAACFDSGKSFLASRLAMWWIESHPPGDALVVSTATTFHQVRAILWQEIGNAHEAHNLTGKVSQTEWKIGNRLVGFGRRPRDWSPDALTGHHRPYVLVIVDESSGVPKVIFEALEGLITNEDSRILAIGNPYAADSHFAHICRPESAWNAVHISAFDTPAFTGEQMPDRAMRSLISQVWVDELRVELGQGYEAHPLWQTKVLGLFPDEGDDQLISLAWVRAAVDHQVERETNHPTISVDVARYGEDETVIGARWGHHFEILQSFRKKPTTYTAGAVVRWVHDLACRDVRVDDDGVGGGVTDQLREQGIKVDALHGGAVPSDPTKFVNARSEWWWKTRLWFAGGEPDVPDDTKLQAQLTSVHWTLDSKGRIAVESKDDMRKRGVKSPDRADALVYSLASSRAVAPVVSPSGVAGPSHNRVG